MWRGCSNDRQRIRRGRSSVQCSSATRRRWNNSSRVRRRNISARWTRWGRYDKIIDIILTLSHTHSSLSLSLSLSLPPSLPHSLFLSLPSSVPPSLPPFLPPARPPSIPHSLYHSLSSSPSHYLSPSLPLSRPPSHYLSPSLPLTRSLSLIRFQTLLPWWNFHISADFLLFVPSSPPHVSVESTIYSPT